MSSAWGSSTPPRRGGPCGADRVVPRGAVRTGADAEHSEVVMAKRGERAEIRPLFDPTLALHPSAMPVRVYIDGDGAAGMRVWATHLATGAAQSAISDGRGIAQLEVAGPGPWLVEFHHVYPVGPGDDEADWVVFTGTMVFESLAPAGGRDEGAGEARAAIVGGRGRRAMTAARVESPGRARPPGSGIGGPYRGGRLLAHRSEPLLRGWCRWGCVADHRRRADLDSADRSHGHDRHRGDRDRPVR